LIIFHIPVLHAELSSQSVKIAGKWELLFTKLHQSIVSKRCNFVQLKYRNMSLLIDYLQIPDLITEKEQKDKQRSTKHYTENKRLSNTNLTKNRVGKQLDFLWHANKTKICHGWIDYLHISNSKIISLFRFLCKLFFFNNDKSINFHASSLKSTFMFSTLCVIFKELFPLQQVKLYLFHATAIKRTKNIE
jgi:hypothetical protein